MIILNTWIEKHCLLCGNDECEKIFILDDKLKTEIHWFNCSPDDFTKELLSKYMIMNLE